MILWFDTTSGQISLPPAGNPTIPMGLAAFDWPDTATPSPTQIQANPALYLYQDAKVVEAPNLTLASAVDTTTTPPTVTVTATLANPPATPPSDVTFTVAGSTQQVALSGGTAALKVQLHPSVAGGSVPCAVSAAGCVGASVDLGTAGVANDTLQLVGAAAPFLVAPTHRATLQAYRAGLLGGTILQAVEILQALGLSVAWLSDAFLTLANWAMAQASPPSFSAAEKSALNYLTTNQQPKLPIRLGALLDGSGNPVAQLVDTLGLSTALQAAFTGYDSDVALIGAANLS